MSVGGGGRLDPGAAVREAASLIRLLGGVGSTHLTVVGGLGPALLVPGAASSHLGTRDLDLCMSVALADGQTRDYYRSVQEIIAPYFVPVAGTSFRWKKRPEAPGLPLVVDFLAPESEMDPAPAGERALVDETAADNAGVLLRPFTLRTGALIDRDADEGLYEDVQMLYGEPGVLVNVRMRHAGPVGFLAAKADALEKRHETKDGYDVSWWCLNAGASAEAVAELVINRPAFRDELFQESVAELASAFKSPEHHGPRGYGSEVEPEATRDVEAHARACNEAYLRVSGVIAALRARLFE